MANKIIIYCVIIKIIIVIQNINSKQIPKVNMRNVTVGLVLD